MNMIRQNFSDLDEAVYERIRAYYPEMKMTYEKLKQLYLNKLAE